MASNEDLKKAVVDIVNESWRLNRMFNKILSKCDATEQAKYDSQFKWYLRKVYDAINIAEIELIDLEGQEYDIGMPVTPINIDDFDVNETLVVVQMIEPIIMDKSNNSVIKTGTVMLGGKNNGY